MKSFSEYLTELTNVHSDYIEWDGAAKAKGLKIEKQTHPSGVGHHFVAKDSAGNQKGHYDPHKQTGKIFS